MTEAAIPGVTIVYGEGDWPSVLARTGPHATRFGPQNDGTDGRVITVGDVSVKIVTMPGHTPGTLSFLFEFKDKGKPIRVAYPGGTAISFTNPDPAFYDQYIASARKFAQAAAAYRRHRADVESHRVRQRLLQGEYGGYPARPPRQQSTQQCMVDVSHGNDGDDIDVPEASEGRAQSVFRRSTGGAELHGRGRALRHGSQAPGDRQPLGYGSLGLAVPALGRGYGLRPWFASGDYGGGRELASDHTKFLKIRLPFPLTIDDDDHGHGRGHGRDRDRRGGGYDWDDD